MGSSKPDEPRSAAGDDWAAPVNSIELQLQRLRQLVRDLRQLADLEQRAAILAPLDITDLLRDVVAVVGEERPADRDRLLLNMPAVLWTLPPVAAERDFLFLALYNLVDNALKFSAPPAQVEVRLTADDGGVRIEVADSGPGIEADDLPHIFEELYRGKRHTDVVGSGLGLALVQAIIRQHYGSVILKSEVGRGTLATVMLPTHKGGKS